MMASVAHESEHLESEHLVPLLMLPPSPPHTCTTPKEASPVSLASSHHEAALPHVDRGLAARAVPGQAPGDFGLAQCHVTRQRKVLLDAR